MKFMTQSRFFGRMYREEGADGGDGEGAGDGAGEGDAGAGANDAAVEWQAKLDAIQAENDRLQAKINEANKHTKEAERTAKEAARKKAEAEGNYQQLYESSEQERERLHQELESERQTKAQERINTEALRIATSMADGPNAEILADYIAKRLKYADGSIKVTDINGNLTVSTPENLKAEFAGSARYASLLKGNQSSGGGAAGGSSSSSATTQTIRRADFNQLNATDQAKFMKAGGKVTDE